MKQHCLFLKLIELPLAGNLARMHFASNTTSVDCILQRQQYTGMQLPLSLQLHFLWPTYYDHIIDTCLRRRSEGQVETFVQLESVFSWRASWMHLHWPSLMPKDSSSTLEQSCIYKVIDSVNILLVFLWPWINPCVQFEHILWSLCSTRLFCSLRTEVFATIKKFLQTTKQIRF